MPFWPCATAFRRFQCAFLHAKKQAVEHVFACVVAAHALP